MGAVVVVGGYGNAGRAIVELLIRHTDRPIVVAGRSLARAEAFASSMADPRVAAARADATDPASLGRLLDGAEAMVVAAGTSQLWRATAEASLVAGCHQFDIQIGSAKNAGLRGLDARARNAGVCIVTDCGFHPGVPAAMVRAVAGALPGLRETGFYVGGFPAVVNYGVIPLVYAGMKVAPRRAARPLGRLLDVGLRRFSRPPYATILQLDGGEADQPVEPLMRLRHDDAYLLTAAPVVAAIRQVLAAPRPGVHLQGMLVEPTAFFADLAAMGVEVWGRSPTAGSGGSIAPGEDRG